MPNTRLKALYVLFAASCAHAFSVMNMPPPDYERTDTSSSTQRVDVRANVTTWINFSASQQSVSWQCNGMASTSTASLGKTSSLWSVQLTISKHPWPCGQRTGRLRWNVWEPSSYTTSVPFSSLQLGYACVKIPVLLRTVRNTLIAFAEARRDNCSDFAGTDLIYRRSETAGATWGDVMRVPAVANASGLCGNSLVVGNAAPVQLSAQNDDGVSFSRPRRLDVLDKFTSATGPDCKRNLTYFGVNSTASMLDLVRELGWGRWDPYVRWKPLLSGNWQFIGVGPPGSIALRQKPNRVLVPGYHSYIRGLAEGTGAKHGAGADLPVSQLYNNVAFGHMLVSDTAGDEWHLESSSGFGGGHGRGANEAQLVELANHSVLVNSRSLSTGTPQYRVQAVSNDAGATFSPTRFQHDLPEPFAGCASSMIAAANGSMLYYSHPNSAPNRGVAPAILQLLGGSVNLTGRDHLTLWVSTDQGNSYQEKLLVDEGAAGYSSLQLSTDETALWLFYEQSDPPAESLSELGLQALIGSLSVLDPDRLVLRKVELPMIT